MRIVIFSDNYPPETNPGAVRTSAHARRWASLGHHVVVITSFPNFPEGKVYDGYAQKLYDKSDIDGVTVVRVPTLIFPNSGTVRRIVDFVSYMFSASIAGFFIPRPDVVIATSPNFFAAVAGWAVSFVRRRPFILELRDLWPDSIIAVGAMRNKALLAPIRFLERFLYRRADAIISVTHAFKSHIAACGVDTEKLSVIRNGADVSRFSPGDGAKIRKLHGHEGKVIVSYIGTLGMAHGLELLLEAASILERRVPQVAIVIIGTGAEAEKLRNRAGELNLRNVQFVERVGHEVIIEHWRASDMTVVLLRDTPLFRTVIPSKVFEAMATGTPIITNVKGELENLLEPLGSAVFVEPGSVDALVAAIEKLAKDGHYRKQLSEAGLRAAPQFDRNAQADRMLQRLEQLVGSK